MGYDWRGLMEMPKLDSVSEAQAHLVVSARLWVALRKRGSDPATMMEQRFGSEAASWNFWLLMEEVGTAWPDPFMVSPPCCRRMSHDEKVLLDMIQYGADGDRGAFLRLLQEMLPVEIADRLYASTRTFLVSLTAPASP